MWSNETGKVIRTAGVELSEGRIADTQGNLCACVSHRSEGRTGVEEYTEHQEYDPSNQYILPISKKWKEEVQELVSVEGTIQNETHGDGLLLRQLRTDAEEEQEEELS